MSILSAIGKLFKGIKAMPAVDFSDLDADIDALAVQIAKVAAAITASGAGSAAQIAKLQADLASEQASHAADIATAQASEADIQVKLKAQIDALSALLPADPAPPVAPAEAPAA